MKHIRLKVTTTEVSQMATGSRHAVIEHVESAYKYLILFSPGLIGIKNTSTYLIFSQYN